MQEKLMIRKVEVELRAELKVLLEWVAEGAGSEWAFERMRLILAELHTLREGAIESNNTDGIRIRKKRRFR